MVVQSPDEINNIVAESSFNAIALYVISAFRFRGFGTLLG